MNIYEGITRNLKHEQLINNIEYVIGGYANGMSDDPDSYKPMTEDELIKYCYSEIFDIKNDGEGGTRLLKGICDDLKFLGNDLIKSEILRIGKEEGVLTAEKKESDDSNTSEETRTKYYGTNYDPYKQSQEVKDEINKGTCFVNNFDELLDDYESNHDSDFYIDVIKRAQTNLALSKEKKAKDLEVQNKQKADKDAERQYREDKRKLAALRKNHSTNVDLIETLYNRIKKYEEEHK